MTTPVDLPGDDPDGIAARLADFREYRNSPNTWAAKAAPRIAARLNAMPEPQRKQAWARIPQYLRQLISAHVKGPQS